jgi:hypothetical protein
VLSVKAQVGCTGHKVSTILGLDVPKSLSEERSADRAILLLNCRSCDDILRVDEHHPRVCMCGKSTARRVHDDWICSGPSRLLSITFEEYDGAAPGIYRRWKALS